MLVGQVVRRHRDEVGQARRRRARAPARRCPSRRCRARRCGRRRCPSSGSAQCTAGAASLGGRSGTRSIRSFGKRSSMTCAKPMRRSISAERRVACDASSSVSRGRRRPCAPSSSPAVRPAARLSAPTWVSRIEPATSENSVTTWTPAAHQLVDRQLDRRQVGRHQRDALAIRDLRQARRRTARRRRRRGGSVTSVMCWWRKSPRRLRDLALDQVEERRCVGRQHEGEAEVGTRARPAALRRRADLGNDLQHALHRSALTPGRLLRTRSTVAVPTPARAAMSAMVAVFDMRRWQQTRRQSDHINK